MAVDFFYLFPYEGAIDPSLLEQEPGKGDKSAVLLEDMAVASGVTLRLNAVVRRLAMDQRHLAARQLRHNETLVSSERRVARWSLVEVVVLALLSVAQFGIFKAAFRNY